MFLTSSERDKEWRGMFFRRAAEAAKKPTAATRFPPPTPTATIKRMGISHAPTPTPIMSTAASAQDAEFPCRMKLEIPFPTKRLADIAHRALAVDKELSPLVRRSFSLEAGPSSSPSDGPGSDATLLNIHYEAATNRMLRVAVNSFLDSLHLTVQVMEQLDEDMLEQQKD